MPLIESNLWQWTGINDEQPVTRRWWGGNEHAVPQDFSPPVLPLVVAYSTAAGGSHTKGKVPHAHHGRHPGE